MDLNIPLLNNKFVCVVDYRKPELAAVIVSYLGKQGYYLPLFEYPSVTAEKKEDDHEIIDENTPSRIRADEFSIFLNNVLAREQFSEILVLAGITKEQKSFLDFLDKVNVIEIEKLTDVDFHLSAFLDKEKQITKCNSKDLLCGLFSALKNEAILEIDESSENLQIPIEPKKGIVIIEAGHEVGSIIGVNYAYSIDSNICVVNNFDKDEYPPIPNSLQDWKKGNSQDYENIKETVRQRIGHLNFGDFLFATFFTAGLPYSLIIKNCIPCSYVNIELRPDFFVINNLLFENKKNHYGAAVIFSPEFFENEETKLVSKIFEAKNYFVKELFGKSASVNDLSMHLKEFPYDVFHLCSHGGEVEGRTIEENFKDQDGKIHKIEYDEVLCLSPSPKANLISVQRKTYFKKFDGLVWRSQEFKSKKYPHYVFSDMQNAMQKSKAKDKKILVSKKIISNSSAIQCSDGKYQAMVSTLAAHSSPLIFNNTCWSWYPISESFLVSGARGYIGTLWNVENEGAIKFSNEFYKNLFNETFLDSFYNALKSIEGSNNENIYVYWGLHFSSISTPASKETTRETCLGNLLSEIYRWEANLAKTKSQKTIELLEENILWLKKQVVLNFSIAEFKKLNEKISALIKEAKREK